MTDSYLLAIDQGTTSSRAIVFDKDARIIAVAQQEFAQIYPKAGWVEHQPEDIWQTTLSVTQQAIQEAESQGGKVIAIGITNQRETTLVWDRATGEAIYNAIVWQDRRTAEKCKGLAETGVELEIQTSTGLLLDPYFSATKVAWILDNVEGARDRANKGELAFGTVDTFLIWRLTGGNSHVTDATNASRTSLYNINAGSWDSRLLEIFDVPEQVLPAVKNCADHFGDTDPALFGRSIPILGVAGDQQAATIGQGCFSPGSIKSTYGTGCFVLLNTGEEAITSKNRLLTTVAYQLKGVATYALEGSIFIAGAAVQWLRDELGMIADAKETQALASSLADNGGVYMVPAFTGLGAPHWDPNARGAVFGITRGTTPAHFARAALESVCYQTHDLFAAMEQDGVSPSILRVDGGMVANDWLAQYLADVLDITVDRPEVMETTALGAAYLAGLQAGVYQDLDEIQARWNLQQRFEPQMAASTRGELIGDWQQAVDRVLTKSS